MNKYYIKSVFVALFLSVSFALFSQGYVSINQTGAASTKPTILDLSDASNLHLGFLMPNVSLASTTDATTIPGPTAGMIVWNTNAALPLGVGFYYWTGTTLTPNNTWLYINNSGGGSGISGAGTANYVARWTSATNLGTGAAQDNGTGVSISSTALTPVNKLDVNGNAAFGTYAGTSAPTGGMIISGQTGFGTSSPNASAALDITSTVGGLLPPRMSAGQMGLIGSPAAGLMVFNTTTNCIEYYTGSAWQFVTCQCSSAPTTPGGITGSATPCATSTGNIYSITAIPGALYYTWTVPTGATITAGTGTNSITVTMGTSNGSITVTASNSCGTTTASTQAITLSPVPATPGIISGSATPCISSAGNVYSIAVVPGATTYNWTVPAGATITGGAGTTSITVSMGTTAGNISVTATNACGTSAASTLAVTLSSTPVAPGAITGAQTPCSSSTGNVYTIVAVAGATVYNWTVPAGASITAGAGSTSITVTMGTTNGNITVTAGNACGTSAAGPALAITLNNIPATPGTITGSTSYCGAYSTSGHIYSIVAVPGATSYTWTVPLAVGASFTGQGTTSINVTLAASYGTGVITVTATNACGTSGASSTATINVNGTPATPATPSGTTTPTTSTAYTYTIATIANATSYTWSTSNTSLATVTAGGNSTSATITNTATAGTYTICVTATNACGTSASACLTVTSAGCVITHSTVTFNYVSNAAQTWTVPCGITQVTVKLWGAGGGAGRYSSAGYKLAGGSGAYFTGVLSGLSGGSTVLTLTVPKGGGFITSGTSGGPAGWPGGGLGGNDSTYGEYGGGGGGYAVVQVGATYYVLAGGGGGGGAWPGYVCNGGGGGATTGGPGGAGESSSPVAGGGTIAAGGVAGGGGTANGTAGSSLQGGAGGLGQPSGYYGGGAGGGGYYGGGGGNDYGGGGGGGSSYPNATLVSGGITFTITSNLQGVVSTVAAQAVAPGGPAAGIGTGGYQANGGNGQIIITY